MIGLTWQSAEMIENIYQEYKWPGIPKEMTCSKVRDIATMYSK